MLFHHVLLFTDKLSKIQPGEGDDTGGIENSSVTLIMAFLYSIDIGILNKLEVENRVTRSLLLLTSGHSFMNPRTEKKPWPNYLSSKIRITRLRFTGNSDRIITEIKVKSAFNVTWKFHLLRRFKFHFLTSKYFLIPFQFSHIPESGLSFNSPGPWLYLVSGRDNGLMLFSNFRLWYTWYYCP